MKASYRDQRERINQALRDQERLYGDLRAAKGIPAPIIEELPPKRIIKNRSPSSELEDPVKKAISHLLAVHPAVLCAVRQNGGAAMMPGKSGKEFPLYFYRVIREPSDITIVDFTGFLKDGRPFAIEAKRPGWHYTSQKRERQQQNYITMITDFAHGVGGFATSVNEAVSILAQK